MANEKCKEKPGNMKSGVDAKPLFLQERLLNQTCLNQKTTVLSKGNFELEYQKASKLQLHTNYK